MVAALNFTVVDRFPSFAAAHGHPFLRGIFFVAQNYAELFCDRLFLCCILRKRWDRIIGKAAGSSSSDSRTIDQRSRLHMMRAECRASCAERSDVAVSITTRPIRPAPLEPGALALSRDY